MPSSPRSLRPRASARRASASASSARWACGAAISTSDCRTRCRRCRAPRTLAAVEADADPPARRSADRAHRARRAGEILRAHRCDALRQSAGRRRHLSKTQREPAAPPFTERGFERRVSDPDLRLRRGARAARPSETYMAGRQPPDRASAVNVRSRGARSLSRLPLDLRHRHALPARRAAAAQDHLRRNAAALRRHADRRLRAARRGAPAHRLDYRGDRRASATSGSPAVDLDAARQRRRRCAGDAGDIGNPHAAATATVDGDATEDGDERCCHATTDSAASRRRSPAPARSAGACRRRRFRKRRRMDTTAMQPPLAPASGPRYQPVVTLNGWTLPWRMNGDWKEFHLVAEPVVREIRARHEGASLGLQRPVAGPDHRGRRGRQGAHLRHQQAARAHHACTGTACSCRTAWTASAA